MPSSVHYHIQILVTFQKKTELCHLRISLDNWLELSNIFGTYEPPKQNTLFGLFIAFA